MSVLLGILGFFAMLGILVFIHELGHFLAAKLFGVRVEVFSLGFLGKILHFRHGDTLYQIGWLPLGGYVKMLGAHPSESCPEEWKPYSFSHKPLWQRSIIILAGPLANIIVLPILALSILYSSKTKDLSTVIGSVVVNSPAFHAKLKPGDQIEEVNGRRTLYFRDLLKSIGQSTGKSLSIKIKRDAREIAVRLTPKIIFQKDAFGRQKKRGIIGVTSSFLLPEIGIADIHSPSYQGGLRTWDRVISVNGEKIERWDQLVSYRKQHPKGPYTYLVKRPILYDGPILHFFRLSSPQKFIVHPCKVKKSDGSEFYYDGLHSSELFVAAVRHGTPLAKAGILPGDRLIEIAGEKLMASADLASLPENVNHIYSVVFERGGRTQKKQFTLFPMTWVDPLNQKHSRVLLGIRLSSPYRKGIEIPIEKKWSYVFDRAVSETWALSGLLIRAFAELFKSETPTESLGGPIMIFQIAQEAVKSGFETFLRHMTLISINLGIFNLLPIPMLDGGHLLFFLIEGVIRKPVPQKIKESAFLLGLLCLLFLLFFALKNDLQRVFF